MTAVATAMTVVATAMMVVATAMTVVATAMTVVATAMTAQTNLKEKRKTHIIQRSVIKWRTGISGATLQSAKQRILVNLPSKQVKDPYSKIFFY